MKTRTQAGRLAWIALITAGSLKKFPDVAATLMPTAAAPAAGASASDVAPTAPATSQASHRERLVLPARRRADASVDGVGAPGRISILTQSTCVRPDGHTRDRAARDCAAHVGSMAHNYPDRRRTSASVAHSL